MANKFYLIEFLELPSANTKPFVIVPKSWVLIGPNEEGKISVKYSTKNPLKTNEKARNNEEPAEEWGFYSARVKKSADTYDTAKSFIRWFRQGRRLSLDCDISDSFCGNQNIKVKNIATNPITPKLSKNEATPKKSKITKIDAKPSTSKMSIDKKTPPKKTQVTRQTTKEKGIPNDNHEETDQSIKENAILHIVTLIKTTVEQVLDNKLQPVLSEIQTNIDKNTSTVKELELSNQQNKEILEQMLQSNNDMINTLKRTKQIATHIEPACSNVSTSNELGTVSEEDKEREAGPQNDDNQETEEAISSEGQSDSEEGNEAAENVSKNDRRKRKPTENNVNKPPKKRDRPRQSTESNPEPEIFRNISIGSQLSLETRRRMEEFVKKLLNP